MKAEISSGVVGSIYLVGGGDPLLSAAWYPKDKKYSKYEQEPATSLEALADAVVAAGVTQINGNIVGDASHFDSELYAPSWPIEFRAIQGGPISALLVNDGLVFGDSSRSTDPALEQRESSCAYSRSAGHYSRCADIGTISCGDRHGCLNFICATRGHRWRDVAQ